MCCAPIVYMFVYILIEAHIVPLKALMYASMYAELYSVNEHNVQASDTLCQFITFHLTKQYKFEGVTNCN